MSDDALGFEPVDDELRRRLGAGRGAGTGTPDPDATLAALRPRYHRAKRRHQLLVGGGSALALVAALGLGTAVVGSGGSGPSGGRQVGIPPAHRVAPDRPAATTTVPSPAPTAPTSDTAVGGGAVGPTTPGATTPTAPSPTPTTQTYTSPGGAVTVKLENGALSIVATSPAAGFAEERGDTGPDRVEVRFKSNDTEWRIRVDLLNGAPIEQTTQH